MEVKQRGIRKNNVGVIVVLFCQVDFLIFQKMYFVQCKDMLYVFDLEYLGLFLLKKIKFLDFGQNYSFLLYTDYFYQKIRFGQYCFDLMVIFLGGYVVVSLKIVCILYY